MLENGKTMPSVDAWLREAKADASAAGCGMYLTHNGVVRATPKAEARGVETDGVAPGHKVGGMVFGFDAQQGAGCYRGHARDAGYRLCARVAGKRRACRR